MELLSLLLYGGINVAMVLCYLRGEARFYQFPFWAGVIALGWFYPQAIGGYFNFFKFPDYAYCNAMLFASLCTLALWFGFSRAVKKKARLASWLQLKFNASKLYYVGAALCLAGFYFYWKLWNLPEEELARTQWTGAAVKYLFLASVFKLGFLVLWLRYLVRGRWLDLKSLAFIVPCLCFLLSAAFLRGRRSEMMNLLSYVPVALWFCRNRAIPRWFIISGLIGGFVLINGIGIYRSIMMDNRLTLEERIKMALRADYVVSLEKGVKESGHEFKNYVFQRQAYADKGSYDYGAYHWNQLVFNYIPAQVVGAELKESLMLPVLSMSEVVKNSYGFAWAIGSTSTGYTDSFGSFGWLGVVKFGLIGVLMGRLYSYATSGAFLARLLYVYCLTTAMVGITHETNEILIRVWVYFFALCYPLIYWARSKHWAGNKLSLKNSRA
jgi:hypothetical protein